MKRSQGNHWSEKELAAAVRVFVLLLRLQLEGGNFRAGPVAESLLRNQLPSRNAASIRYRLRNISAVTRELGAPTLEGFSPAESVGKNVRARIKKLLEADTGFRQIIGESVTEPSTAKADALDALGKLESKLEDLRENLVLRSHNQPPELVSDTFPDRDMLVGALSDIANLRLEISRTQPDALTIKTKRDKLLELAEAAAKWLGTRFTKFTDAALATAAPIVVAKATGILPAVVDALEALSRVITS